MAMLRYVGADAAGKVEMARALLQQDGAASVLNGMLLVRLVAEMAIGLPGLDLAQFREPLIHLGSSSMLAPCDGSPGALGSIAPSILGVFAANDFLANLWRGCGCGLAGKPGRRPGGKSDRGRP